MAAPFVSHSQSAICNALGLYATEATAVEHFESEGEHFDPAWRFGSAVPSAKWWSGTLSGFAALPAPVVAPVPHVCTFIPLTPSIKAPVVYGLEYELTLTQETISFPLFNVNPLIPNVIGYKAGEGISGRWRYRGLMSDSGYPIDDTLLVNLRWNAEWKIAEIDYISMIAQIEEMQLGLSDGVVTVDMAGRSNGLIGVEALETPIVNPAVMWGNITTTLGPGKTISGACVITRVTIQRDCSRLRMSADWINQGAMAVAWS
jgi:hypothetical protein